MLMLLTLRRTTKGIGICRIEIQAYRHGEIKSPMKLATGLLGVLIILTLAGCGGASSVESGLKKQMEYITDENWRGIYDELCSSEWREEHDYEVWKDDFAAAVVFVKPFGDTFSVANLEVEANGDTALASYTFMADDTPLASAKGEEWIKEGGKWRQKDCS